MFVCLGVGQVYNRGAQIIGAGTDEAKKYCAVVPCILGS